MDHTAGIVAANAAQSHHYEVAARTHGDPRPDARPEWDDLTAREQDEHREECPDMCDECEGHRTLGDCVSCKGETEEVRGASLCCGSRVVYPSPVEDNRRADGWGA